MLLNSGDNFVTSVDIFGPTTAFCVMFLFFLVTLYRYSIATPGNNCCCDYFIEVALFLLSPPEDNVLIAFLCVCLSVCYTAA